jgi:hypothetical protein
VAQLSISRRGFVSRVANHGFEFHKRSQLFIRAHNEAFSVAMCVSNPGCSPFEITG